jgi:hypothetical protein
MKLNKLEKELDARFADIGFPSHDDPTIPPAMRIQLAHCIARFYSGEVLVVDRRGNALRIYARTNPNPGGLTFPKKSTLG